MDIQELNVSPEIRSAVEAMGFEELTEIQEKAIPVLMEGHDVIEMCIRDSCTACCCR